jgi:hypothetical protein
VTHSNITLIIIWISWDLERKGFDIVSNKEKLIRYTKSESKRISNLIKDIKVNKIGYIKNPSLVIKVRDMAPEIDLEYVKDDNIWIAKYNHFK